MKKRRSFEDPAAASGTGEQKTAKFREVRDRIEQRIKDWLATTQKETQ